MAIYLSNRDGLGQTNEQGHFKFPTVLFDGAVVGPDSVEVTQNSPLGMSVLIAPGDFKIDTTGDYAYTGWIDANEAVVIATSDPANPRIDAVVLYVDKGAATSPSPSNNPGIIKTMAIAGTPGGVPSAPNDAAIQSAVGAGNPFIRLANVTVAAAVTQITNASIADTRVLVTITDSTVDASSIQDDSITSAKLAPSKTVDANGWTVYDFGTWKEYMKRFTGLTTASMGAGAAMTVSSGNTFPVGVVPNTVNIFTSGQQYPSGSGSRFMLDMYAFDPVSVAAATFDIVARNITGSSIALSGGALYIRMVER